MQFFELLLNFKKLNIRVNISRQILESAPQKIFRQHLVVAKCWRFAESCIQVLVPLHIVRHAEIGFRLCLFVADIPIIDLDVFHAVAVMVPQIPGHVIDFFLPLFG